MRWRCGSFGPLRGRPFLLGLALVALMAAFGSEAATQSGDSLRQVDGFGLSTGQLLGVVGWSGGALLVVGLIYLVVSAVLDSQGLRGLATCFVAAALIGALFGTYLVAGTFDDTSGALFAAAIGFVLAVVGAMHQRRFTAWAGALIVTAALAAAMVAIVTPGSSTVAGACVLVAGIVLGALAFGLLWFEAYRARPRDARPPASTLPSARKVTDCSLTPPLVWVSEQSQTDSSYRPATISAISSPASVGFSPTFTPAAARASIFPCAVPLPPLTIAPAWPIFLPAGAVTPAM